MTQSERGEPKEGRFKEGNLGFPHRRYRAGPGRARLGNREMEKQQDEHDEREDD